MSVDALRSSDLSKLVEMVTSPRKAGIVITIGNPWEIVFTFLALEKHGFLRIPISVPAVGPSDLVAELQSELARHSIIPIAEVKATGVDTFIIPGGRRLFNSQCNFETAGDGFKVDETLKTFLKGVYRLNKPIAAFGESSVLVVKALQGITRSGTVVTVGSDPRLQAAVSSTGGQTVVTRPGEVVLDETNKLVTSGGELGTKRPTEVYESCENVVSGILELINK